MKKALAILIPVIALIALGSWYFTRKPSAPHANVAKTRRETLSNVLSTNGKVEPLEFQEVRVESRGLVKRLLVHVGDTVRAGQLLVELSAPGLQDEIDAASAREAQTRADLQTLEAGGRSADTSELSGNLNRLRSDRDAAQKVMESLQRLQQKQAATAYEVDQAMQAVRSLDVQIQGLEQRRTSLVGKGDLAGAQARVRESEANLALARSHTAVNIIRSPISGTIYDLPIRAGSFLNVGDAVASVGKLDPVRVKVYVDEPELGRVAAGERVRITWDAIARREWNGTVERRPSEVIALGARQVGEVPCTIQNPNHELAPGTNVNAFILTQVVENALTVPKSAVHRDNGIGVFVVQPDNTVKWAPVTTGASDALRVEILSGLKDGDQVVESTEAVLKTGMSVTP
jgi:HlyD family secretion protein